MRGEGSGAVGRKWSNWENNGMPESQDSDYKHMYIDLRYRRLSGTRRIAEKKGPSQTEQHQMSRNRTTIKQKLKTKTKKQKNKKPKKPNPFSLRGVGGRKGVYVCVRVCMCVCVCPAGSELGAQAGAYRAQKPPPSLP